MNTQVTVNRLLAVVALVLFILSFVVSGPLIAIGCILLALAVLI